jgi:hypothetical protein
LFFLFLKKTNALTIVAITKGKTNNGWNSGTEGDGVSDGFGLGECVGRTWLGDGADESHGVGIVDGKRVESFQQRKLK